MNIKTTPQETAMSVLHILAISAAALVGTLGLIAEPYDNDPNWAEIFILSKGIAATGWYVAWRLYEKWKKIDKWLAAYDKSCEEALKAPNTICLGKEEESE